MNLILCVFDIGGIGICKKGDFGICLCGGGRLLDIIVRI